MLLHLIRFGRKYVTSTALACIQSSRHGVTGEQHKQLLQVMSTCASVSQAVWHWQQMPYHTLLWTRQQQQQADIAIPQHPGPALDATHMTAMGCGQAGQEQATGQHGVFASNQYKTWV